MSLLPADTSRLKVMLGFVFGFSLLFILGWLAFHIALGKVEMQTSYGLDLLIGALATLCGSFANWAFGIHRPEVDENKEAKK